jgi:transcriptional regulator with XRE-family HTH domain
MSDFVLLQARQIRAARALLDWSQDDLAAACGLSAATIRKLELGHISPRGSTTQQVRQALEDQGLEFLAPDGVRHRPEGLSTYDGAEGFLNFLDDIYIALRQRSGEVLMVASSDTALCRNFGVAETDYRDRLCKIARKAPIRCVFTDPRFEGPDYASCRWLPQHCVDAVPFIVFADSCGMLMLDGPGVAEILCLQASSVARSYRSLFDTVWTKARPVDGTLSRPISA